MKKPTRTQWFRATAASPAANRPGRYLAWPQGKTKPVFRWWTGTRWQFNRIKKNETVEFGCRPHDLWAGVAQRSESAFANSSLAK